MNDESNIGRVGIDSIRLGGMRLEALPIAEGAITKQQWPEVVANAKRQEIENIVAEFPKGAIVYYQGRINECMESIQRIRQLRSDQEAMINEYKSYISLCKHRDKQIAKLDPERDREVITQLRRDFPPYNVEAMEEQIVQCQEAIERSDVVVDQEHASIAELKSTIGQCEIRDKQLQEYGVVVR